MGCARYPCPFCQPDLDVLVALEPAAYATWVSKYLEHSQAKMARAATIAKIWPDFRTTQRPTWKVPEASRSLSTSDSDATAGSPETPRP